MPFPQSVLTDPAPGIEGDWCSVNRHHSALADPGRFVSGPLGVTIGRFAFATASGVLITGGVGPRPLFVGRTQVALIQPYLGESTMQTLPNVEVTAYDGGDFWARFAAGAAIGQKVFANALDGSCIAGALGATVNGAVVTASQAANVLTVTAVASGTLIPGQVLTGANITGPLVGESIVAQLSGTTGGVGTYSTSASGTAASATVNGQGASESFFYVHTAAGNNELAKISGARSS